MMRDMLMPLRSAARDTEPVIVHSSGSGLPSRVATSIGRRKPEIPTCWIGTLAPWIREASLFCMSGSVAR